MKVIFAREDLSKLYTPSVFLAGPTPRSADVKSWRIEAIKLFEEQQFTGNLIVPEDINWGLKEENYDAQVEWEEKGLNEADCIMFWIPRNLVTLPGFTTNDEWGVWKQSGKVVLGVPDDAEKCRYQIYYAKKLHIAFSTSLQDTIKNAIKLAEDK